MSKITLSEGAAAATPAAGEVVLYVKADGYLYSKDDAGVETLASSAGLTAADSPQFAGVNVGHATDTTITRVSAGVIAVEGVTVLLNGGALGTPSSGVGTNLTGTAAGLTAGNVTTNANLTGHITSTGNAAVLGSFTLAQLNSAISDANVASTLGSVAATTSGASFDFTGFPAGTKQILVTFSGVSLSGTDDLLVQLGDAGGIETSGYVSASGSAANTSSSTAGFVMRAAAATNVTYGQMLIALCDSSAFEWTASHSARVASTAFVAGGGNKALSAELTQIRILATGSNTFDAGKINIQYF